MEAKSPKTMPHTPDRAEGHESAENQTHASLFFVPIVAVAITLAHLGQHGAVCAMQRPS